MNRRCNECDGSSRREFLLTAGAAAATLWTPGSLFADPSASRPVAETKIKEFYDSLSPTQRKAFCFSAVDPLRKKVSANWKITETSVSSLTEPQQEMVEGILQGLTSEDGYGRFQKQMEDDAGGIGDYSVAFFGEPGKGIFEFVLTGRHMTIRGDGNTIDGVAFGGPMVYGHAASGFTEKPVHPGNVFWYQAKRANEVFAALDGKQRAKSLIEKAPAEDQITHRPSGYPGIAVGELSSDQKTLVQAVMGDLLSPYRKQDADEVLELITKNGGLEKIHLSFYRLDEAGKNADIGKDGVWDVWRLEGPGFVWHFRGAPHVHTWVNIAKV